MGILFSRGLLLVPVFLLAAASIFDAELKPGTIVDFDRYVSETERQLDARGKPFLWVDGQPANEKKKALDSLSHGGLVIKELKTKAGRADIKIEDGLVHHWIGTVFVRDRTVTQAVTLLQDYNRHQDIYKPNVARSKTLSRDGERFKLYLRFYMKKALTVVVNSDHEAVFTREPPDRASSRIRSTRIQEVENPDTPDVGEKPVGKDRGFLWRLNSYWRFLERDGGVYIQCESITLTRSVPFLIAPLVRSVTDQIPEETLSFTLEATRKELKRP